MELLLLQPILLLLCRKCLEDAYGKLGDMGSIENLNIQKLKLLEKIWGYEYYGDTRTVDVHIRRLRKALELSGHDRMVQTVRGTGYRFSTRF